MVGYDYLFQQMGNDLADLSLNRWVLSRVPTQILCDEEDDLT